MLWSTVVWPWYSFRAAGGQSSANKGRALNGKRESHQDLKEQTSRLRVSRCWYTRRERERERWLCLFRCAHQRGAGVVRRVREESENEGLSVGACDAARLDWKIAERYNPAPSMCTEYTIHECIINSKRSQSVRLGGVHSGVWREYFLPPSAIRVDISRSSEESLAGPRGLRSRAAAGRSNAVQTPTRGTLGARR